MTKACFEAHLIGMALQARQPDPGPSLGNGQWAKELLTELLPTFKWKNPKAAATKSTTNAIAFVNVPVLRDDGTPEAEQHRFICDFLHVESSTLTHEQMVRFQHMGSHHRDAMRLHKDELRCKARSSGAGAASSSTSLAVAGPMLGGTGGGAHVGGDTIPPGVRHMASLIEVDGKPQGQGARSWLAPFGGPVAAFFIFGGPPEVTEYIWHTKSTRMDSSLIEHRPAVARQSSDTCTHGHSYLDTFGPGPLYAPCPNRPCKSKSARACAHASCRRCSKRLYQRVLFCKGSSGKWGTAASATSGPRPNCTRECGGAGVCAPHCQGLANLSRGVADLHCCAARIVIEVTAALLSRGKVRTAWGGVVSRSPSLRGRCLGPHRPHRRGRRPPPSASHGAAFGSPSP